jgi:hypothetical protein
MNNKIAQTLVDSLTTFFSEHCKVLPPDPHSRAVPIEVPLSGYDDENIIVFVEQNGGQTILHDGGRAVDYLADHDIAVHLNQKKYALYARFYQDLAKKHGFTFSERQRRFEIQIQPDQGQKALVFVECLICLNFLVMTKWAGMKTHSHEEAQKLSGLGMTLAVAFPEIKVAPGLLPEVRGMPARQDWGLTLIVPQTGKRGCIHYLRGPDWAHLSRSAILLNTFTQMSDRWFNVAQDCFWGIYGGPPELLNLTNTLLKDIGNGSATRVISFDQDEKLVENVSDRLGVVARQDWRQRVNLRREALGEKYLSKHTRQASEPAPDQTQADDFWLDDAFSAGFDAAARQLLNETEFRRECAIEPLETYGLAFARYVLAEIKKSPGKTDVSRFNHIADAFLQYYSQRNDTTATNVIDGEVAEIEEQMAGLATSEQVFLQEDQAVNRYLLTELKSLKAELGKLVETKNGK